MGEDDYDYPFDSSDDSITEATDLGECYDVDGNP
jgi:hypothetical protein